MHTDLQMHLHQNNMRTGWNWNLLDCTVNTWMHAKVQASATSVLPIDLAIIEDPRYLESSKEHIIGYPT